MENLVTLGMVKSIMQDTGWGVWETISSLVQGDIPMDEDVIQLGIIMGIMEEDYHNGWHLEDEAEEAPSESEEE